MLEISKSRVRLHSVEGRTQWQLSVREKLQRAAEWLLWVGLCCRSLRKFTDVFSYETPLQRLSYPVAPSISLPFHLSCSCVWDRCGTPFFFFRLFFLIFFCCLSKEHEKLDAVLTCPKKMKKLTVDTFIKNSQKVLWSCQKTSLKVVCRQLL